MKIEFDDDCPYCGLIESTMEVAAEDDLNPWVLAKHLMMVGMAASALPGAPLVSLAVIEQVEQWALRERDLRVEAIKRGETLPEAGSGEVH